MCYAVSVRSNIDIGSIVPPGAKNARDFQEVSTWTCTHVLLALQACAADVRLSSPSGQCYRRHKHRIKIKLCYVLRCLCDRPTSCGGSDNAPWLSCCTCGLHRLEAPSSPRMQLQINCLSGENE